MYDTKKDPLTRIAAGFTRFQERWYNGCDAPFTKLLDGQSPKVMLIACSDSRVDPAILLDAAPGSLFVVRNVGNLVPPYEPDNRHHGVSAALEYGVRFLDIPDIMIMGHAHCGGFESLYDPERREASSFIHIWMDQALEAKRIVDATMPDADHETRAAACAMWGVRLSLRNLMTFPWIKDKVEQGALRLHGLYFDMNSGTLLRFDPQEGRFVSLVAGTCNAT